MAKEHGVGGRAMVSTSGSGSAVAVSLTQWTLNMATDQVEVTSFGDANKTYVQGLKDLQGALSGFLELTDQTLFQGADSTDGVKMYLYPNFTNHPNKYWYGTANLSASIDVGSGGAVAISAQFTARGAWGRNWA